MKKNPLFVTFVLINLALFISACSPVVIKPGPLEEQGRLTEQAFITGDGVELPLSHWQTEETKAVLIALHGFNDYRHFFAKPAEYFSQNNIISYAYDQRGFGASPHRGYWAGADAYVADLELFIRLIKQRHPGTPVYLLGESMGGAVIINTMTRSQKPEVDGIILAAPAVWGRKSMPWLQSALLWSLSHTLPWLTLTGEGLDIIASDNTEMLIALGKDPLVIKETRVDTIYGLVNLMDRALDNAESLHEQTLLLYGEKDEIVPRRPTQLFLQDLMKTDSDDKTIAYYKDGYHMLLRDLEAPILWRDIVSWMESASRPLPSGADRRASELIAPNSSARPGAEAGVPAPAHSRLSSMNKITSTSSKLFEGSETRLPGRREYVRGS